MRPTVTVQVTIDRSGVLITQGRDMIELTTVSVTRQLIAALTEAVETQEKLLAGV